MKEIYRDYLFGKHILVAGEMDVRTADSYRFSVIAALAAKFGIRINKGIRYAHIGMIRDAQRNLGEYVPVPFYRGFPQTVREMTPDQLLYDQLLHYTETYGLGWWDHPGHSHFEDIRGRTMMAKTGEEIMKEGIFRKDILPKDFDILTEAEAEEVLKASVKELLEGTRPLNIETEGLITKCWKDFGTDILPEKIGCKETTVRMLCETRCMDLCRHLVLSDVIKVLNFIQYEWYGSENLKKLNLKNKDRRLLKDILDWFFANPVSINGWHHYINVSNCFEKRKIWCGMLHHIHYHPQTFPGMQFVSEIRNGKNQSAYSGFEKLMREKKPAEAAKYLAAEKGSSVLLRNMNYILSRCVTDDEIEEVFSCLEN